ncbi:hypothetical protein BC938DRAFT_471139, partial [Jimgerdemannia flammicorona]
MGAGSGHAALTGDRLLPSVLRAEQVLVVPSDRCGDWTLSTRGRCGPRSFPRNVSTRLGVDGLVAVALGMAEERVVVLEVELVGYLYIYVCDS